MDATVANSIETQTKAGPIYSVVYTYVVDGSYYGGTFTTRTRYADGEIFALEYDPQKPERNNLTRRENLLRWFYVVFFLGLAAMGIYLFLQPKAR